MTEFYAGDRVKFKDNIEEGRYFKITTMTSGTTTGGVPFEEIDLVLASEGASTLRLYGISPHELELFDQQKSFKLWDKVRVRTGHQNLFQEDDRLWEITEIKKANHQDAPSDSTTYYTLVYKTPGLPGTTTRHWICKEDMVHAEAGFDDVFTKMEQYNK